MKVAYWQLATSAGVATALATLLSCAQVGPVLPPSVHLPRPVQDFRATRLGPAAQLDWTPPRETSDSVPWHGPIRYNVCIWPGQEQGLPPPPPAPVVPAARLPQVPSPLPRNVGASRTPAGRVMPRCPRLEPLAEGPPASLPLLALAATPSGFATLALYAMNQKGEGAGWSNPVVVPLTPVAPPPELLSAAYTREGVRLGWRPANPSSSVAVYRDRQLVAEITAETGYLDTQVQPNQRYVYCLRSTAGLGAARVESAPSNCVQVQTLDVFPPAVPTGLQATAGVPTQNGSLPVDLSWDPVSAPDLAGYNVYRRLGDRAWRKLNQAPIPTPVYHDQLPAGATAAYSVSAIDRAGNESARSAAVSVP